MGMLEAWGLGLLRREYNVEHSNVECYALMYSTKNTYRMGPYMAPNYATHAVILVAANILRRRVHQEPIMYMAAVWWHTESFVQRPRHGRFPKRYLPRASNCSCVKDLLHT